MQPQTISERSFRVRIRAGGKREKEPAAGDSIRAIGFLCVLQGALTREALSSASEWGESVS
jgi:hypothetical protein